jgi:hypothetical protein
MKRIGLCFLSLAAVSSSLFADLTIIQKMEGAGNSNDMTLKLKGEMVRADPSADMTMIMNTKSGETTTLLHSQKMFMVLTGEQAKQMMPQADGEAAEPAPEPKATGEKEKIKTAAGEFEAEKYTFESKDGIKGSFWIAKDYPNGKKIMDQMIALMKGPLGASLSPGTPDMTKLPGLPIKQVVEMEGQPPVTSTIISVKEDPISDDEFKIPAGYTKADTGG